MSATIRQQLRTATLPDGRRALVIDSIIPDDAPVLVREGLARRAIVNSGGDCPPPCNASWPRPNRAQRRHLEQSSALLHVVIEHVDGCPAETELLVAAVSAWQASR
jgi:hypothetical protein